MSVEASAFTDWSVLINKRVRAIRKKLDDITRIEERVSRGEKLLPEQRSKVDQKDSLNASLLELNKLIASAPAVADQPAPAAAPSPAPAPRAASPAGAEKRATSPSASKGSEKDLERVLGLFFAARFLSTRIPGGRENREALLAERKDIEAFEFDALQFLAARIDGSANPFSAAHSIQRSLKEGIDHARHFLHKEDVEVNKGVTYARVSELVQIVFKSEAYVSSLERESSSQKQSGGVKRLNDLLANASNESADPWKEGAAQEDQNEITEEAVNREAEKVLSDLDIQLTADGESTTGQVTPPVMNEPEPEDLAVNEPVVQNGWGDEVPQDQDEVEAPVEEPGAKKVEDENDGFEAVKSGRRPPRGRGRGAHRGRGQGRGGNRGAGRGNFRGGRGEHRGARGGQRGGTPRGGGDRGGKKYVPKNNDS